jgi:hypothetical protein
MKINYTPEKIDEFIVAAEQAVQKGEALFKKYYNDILQISIADLVQSPESYKILSDNIEKSRKSIESLWNKFFDIVDMYEVGEYPDNVSKLDNLATKLDNIQIDISQLGNALGYIIDAGEEITGQLYNK